nr:FtsW/RodA/SpoVE family cell cycle protein [Calditrichia bacterium]
MILDRIKSLDWLLILPLLGLLGMGLVALYSTSQGASAIGNHFQTQLWWMAMGLGTMAIVSLLFPHRFIYDLTYLVYGLSVVLLILVFFFGLKEYGATRWLSIGGKTFQPSELAKFATLLALARFLSDERKDMNDPKNIAIALAIIFLPAGLVFRQPDLGTALVFGVIALPIFFWVGLHTRYLILVMWPVLTIFASFNTFTFVGIIIAITVYVFFWLKLSSITRILYLLVNIGVGFAAPMAWDQLQDYQKQRLLTFWNPEADPLGAGYQIIQSKVAIGSGGFLGKGFCEGSQTQLRFLPEQHTDFIFAVIGEEWGFLGVLLGLLLFALFLSRLVYLASIFKSRF